MKNSDKIPDRIFFNLIVKSDSPELRRKLSELRDRDIAAAMTYLSDFERKIIMSKLPPVKAERVRDAIERNAGIKYDDYKKIITGIISFLSQARGKKEIPDSWYRPGRK